jgi:hypothetical protein
MGPRGQTVSYQQKAKQQRIVHLLNDHSSWGRHSLYQRTYPVREEVLPVHGVRVSFRDPATKRVLLVPGERELPLTRDRAGVSVTVPKLEMHAMVVAER